MIQSTRKILAASTAILTQKQTDILLAAGVIMVSYGASLFLGLIRQRLMGSIFYSCCALELDAFQAAFRIPDLIFQTLVVGTLTTVFIPILAGHFVTSHNSGVQSATRILTLLFIVMLFGGVVVIFAAPWLARLITSRTDPDYLNLVANLMRLIYLSQMIFLFSNWASTVLQTLKKFVAPALAPVTYNLGIIFGTLLLYKQLGIYAPAVGVLVGAILHLCVQLPVLYHAHVPLKFTPKLFDPDISKILAMSWPRLANQGINQIENVLSVYYSSLLVSGSVFLFDLATQLRQVPVQLVGLAIGQAAYPSLAQYSDRNPAGFRKVAQDAILQILYFVLPLTAILLILRIPIVRLAFGSSSFPWRATTRTAATLAFFTIGIPSIAVCQLLARIYYAKKDTLTPLIIQSVGFVVFLLFIFFGFKIYPDLIWLAAGASVSSLVELSLFSSLAGFKWADFWKPVLGQVAKMLGAFYYTLLCLWIPFQFLDELVFDTTRVVPLIALTISTSLIGISVYIIVCHWLDVLPQNYLWRLIMKFPGIKKILSKTQSVFTPMVDVSS